MKFSVIPKLKYCLSRSAVVLCLKLLGTGLAFLITAYISQSLGAATSGQFFYLYTAVLFGATISRRGLDTVMIRFISPRFNNDSHSDEAWVSTVAYRGLGVVLKTAVVTTMALGVFFVFINPLIYRQIELEFSFLIALLAIPCMAIVQFASFAFQATGRVVISTVLFNILFNVTFLTILMFHGALNLQTAYYNLLAACLGALVICMFAHLKFFTLKRDSSAPTSSMLSRIGNPMWFNQITNQTIIYFPIFIGGVFLLSEEIAFLSVSQRIAMLLSFFLLSINYVVSPYLSSILGEQKLQEAQNLVTKVTLLSTIIALALLVLLIIFSKYILAFFGDDFSAARSLFIMYLCGQTINVLSGCANLVFMFTENENVVTKISTLTLLLSVICFPCFMFFWGVEGAGLAFIFVNLVRTFVSLLLLKKVTGISCFTGAIAA